MLGDRNGSDQGTQILVQQHDLSGFPGEIRTIWLAWFTAASPSQTVPSTGISSPGPQMTVSPMTTSSSGTRVSTPSRAIQTDSVCGVSRLFSRSLERCSEVASTYSPRSRSAPMAFAVK